MNIAKRIATVLLSSLLVLVILIMLFNLFLHVRYSDFYRNSKSVGEVAGLGDGLVQQGLDYVEECGALLTSGYMNDGSASRVYVNVDGKEFYTSLKKEDGSDYTGHVGGIAHFGPFLYASCSDGVDVFAIDDVLRGNPTATRLGTIKLSHNASWVTVYNGRLYAGRFAEVGDYVTSYASYPEHTRENPNLPGDMNCSVITEYPLSTDSALGFATTTPTKVISIRDKVQGAAFTESGEIILSTSWGATSSRLYVYGKDINGAADGTMSIDGTDVPLYFLGEDSLTKTVVAPPMAEEIVVIDGWLYIMNESASKKYLFGNFIGGRQLYAYDLTA